MRLYMVCCCLHFEVSNLVVMQSLNGELMEVEELQHVTTTFTHMGIMFAYPYMLGIGFVTVHKI